MPNCIFCQIIARSLPAKIFYEDDLIVGFFDIHPQDNTHILLVPKQHIAGLQDVQAEDSLMLGHLLASTPVIAQILEIDHYKALIHVGKDAGQTIMHLHLHLISRAISRAQNRKWDVSSQ